MSALRRRRGPAGVASAVTAAWLLLPGVAWAHARISPPVSVANQLQLYSLAVPTEKAHALTTKVVLHLPSGFSIDSFVPSPGWRRTATATQVTWTGGHVPTEEDALFQFLGEATNPGTYTFTAEQTYSDGSIVNWSGPESAADPAPAIDVRSSLGGGGSSTLAIIALALGAVALLVGLAALTGAGREGGRPLA